MKVLKSNAAAVGVVNLDRINYLNVILMLLSLALAWIFPFELFLLAYAILGPLHYLTEISWLHERDYFLKMKSNATVFVVLAILLFVTAWAGLLGGVGWAANPWVRLLSGMIPAMIFAGAIFAIVASVWKNRWIAVVSGIVAVGLVCLFGWNNDAGFKLLFAILLPTIIHVFVFTGMFILSGVLKSKSRSGLISLMVFMACALSCFLILPVVKVGALPSAFVQGNDYVFFSINNALANLLHFGQADSLLAMFKSAQAIALMRFVAFAYTYHYLNWFSKTEIIKWHHISSRRFGLIILAWLMAVAVYLADYRLGFMTLYLLSMLHVFLEFPLNNLTVMQIFRDLKGLIPGKH